MPRADKGSSSTTVERKGAEAQGDLRRYAESAKRSRHDKVRMQMDTYVYPDIRETNSMRERLTRLNLIPCMQDYAASACSSKHCRSGTASNRICPTQHKGGVSNARTFQVPAGSGYYHTDISKMVKQFLLSRLKMGASSTHKQLQGLRMYVCVQGHDVKGFTGLPMREN